MTRSRSPLARRALGALSFCAAAVSLSAPAAADTTGVHAGFGLHLTVDSLDRGDSPPGLFGALGWLWGDTPPWYGQGDYQLVAARGWFGVPGDPGDAAALVEYGRGSDQFFIGGRYGAGGGITCHDGACGPRFGVHGLARIPFMQMAMVRLDLAGEHVDGRFGVVATASFGIDVIGWFDVQDRSIERVPMPAYEPDPTPQP